STNFLIQHSRAPPDQHSSPTIRLKLGDFGSAAAVDPQGALPSTTSNGTPGWSAPELFAGELTAAVSDTSSAPSAARNTVSEDAKQLRDSEAVWLLPVAEQLRQSPAAFACDVWSVG